MRSFDYKKFQTALRGSGMNIQEFYKKVGVSDTHLYAIRNGHVKVKRIDMMLSICNELDLDPRDLYIQQK